MTPTAEAPAISTESRIKRWPATLAAAYLATVPILIGWFLPFLVAGFGAMGFTQQQSGVLVSADMLGYTVGTLTMSPLLGRVDWRRTAIILLLAIVFANLVACRVGGITGLCCIRVCAGLASGALAAIALGACAQDADPGSAYGLWQTLQAIAAAAAGLTLPALIDSWTNRGAFVVIALLAAAGLLLVRLLPHRAIVGTSADTRAQTRPSSGPGKIFLAVLAIFMFLGATTAVTAFLEPIGTDMGITPRVVGFALSAAGAASLVGGLLATKMGDRAGYLGPTIAGCLLASLAYVGYVVGAPGLLTLTVGTVAYFGAYSYTSAYFMGTLAVADPSGRAVAIGNGALGGGVTLGPVLGGWIMQATSSTGVLCWVATGMTVLSLTLVLPLQLTISAAASPRAMSEGQSESSR